MKPRHLTSLMAVLAACGISAGVKPGVAAAVPALAAASSARVDRLARHPKIHRAADVLAGLRQGEPEARVIVTLQPPEAADELAARSARSGRVAEELLGESAPAFFDLEDRDIRRQLRERVTEKIDQVVDQLDVPGLSVTERFSYQTAFAARVTSGGLERLLENPEVLRVERDWELEAHTLQGVALMSAEQPSSTYDGSGLSIAICDTGIDTSHLKLRGASDSGTTIFNTKVIGGWDAGDNDGDPRPNPASGSAHGTACAGIAAGNLGAVSDYDGGVAPGAKLYSIKISYGDGGSAYTSDMIEGWEWAVTHRDDDPNNPIKIVSTSFGGSRYYDQTSCDGAAPAMTTAAANALAAGITIFASSGNNGYCSSMAWPACISYVNSVGAVYDGGLGTLGWCVSYDGACSTKATSYSSCSTAYAAFESTSADKVTAYSNSAPFLTLFAPSNHAYTTDIVGTGGYGSGDYVTTFGGTSAASPYAAGAAAVLQSAAKARTGRFLTPTEVRTYLTSYGDSVTDAKMPSVTRPRINLANAVAALPASSQPSISIGDVSANEGNSGTKVFAFPVTLSTASAAPVTVRYATANGTATTANRDYSKVSGTLTFAAGGPTSQVVNVSVRGDTKREANETFYVNLSGATGAAIADGQGVGTILNDD